MRTKKQKFNVEPWIPYIVIAPAFLLILLFKIYPIFGTVWDSFHWKDAFSLRNYRQIFSEKIFWNSLWITLKFNLILTPVQIVISIGMALLVNTKIRGMSAFRTMYYLPVTISMTVACIMWNMMLNPNSGVINSMLIALGLPAQKFLSSPTQALASIMLIATWKGCGYWMMFLLAGLKNIDVEIYESAKIDGASWWKTTTRITLPLLKPALFFVIIADTTANLLLFAPMFMLTKGGPQGSTNVLMYETYKSAFIYADHARAAALMSVMLLIVGTVVLSQFAILNRPEEKKKRRAKS